mmetsp:Transcript_55987/g.128479  ORF Transcript_55987/g.128479 Transcript_55987/m.128479 type:complete len:212 (+) Transcript_55987:377-1012(+)
MLQGTVPSRLRFLRRRRCQRPPPTCWAQLLSRVSLGRPRTNQAGGRVDERTGTKAREKEVVETERRVTTTRTARKAPAASATKATILVRGKGRRIPERRRTETRRRVAREIERKKSMTAEDETSMTSQRRRRVLGGLAKEKARETARVAVARGRITTCRPGMVPLTFGRRASVSGRKRAARGWPRASLERRRSGRRRGRSVWIPRRPRPSS